MIPFKPLTWIKIGGILAVIAGTNFITYQMTNESFLKYKLEQSDAKVSVIEKSHTRELELRDKIDLVKEQKNAEITAVNTRLDTALAGLRNRKDRPSTYMPPTPGTTEGRSGAELFRPDAEFLARESARADKLRIELDRCYTQYEAAREAISKASHASP